MVLFFAWTTFVESYVKVYYPAMASVAMMGGLVLMMVVMFGVGFAGKLMAVDFPYVDGICNGFPNNKIRFYIKHDEVDQPIEQGYYATTITLRWAIYDPKVKGKVEKLHIHHRGLWAERVAFHTGRAFFWGDSVGHPAVSNLWLEEMDMPNIERVKGEPVFELVRGNMDEMSEPILSDNFKQWLKTKKTAKTGDATAENGAAGIDQKTKLLVAELLKLNRKVRELTRRSMKDHEVRLATEETTDQIKNELASTLDIPTKFQAAVVRFVLALWEAFGGIDNVVKTWGRGKVTMTKWVALTILGVAGLFFLYMNPQPVQRAYEWLGMGNNQLFIILLGVVAAAGVYLYGRRKK